MLEQPSMEALQEALKHVVRVGTVTTTDPGAATVRVQFHDVDGLVTWPLRVLRQKTLHDQQYWMPDVGEHVLCLCLPNGAEQGFVVGAFYSAVDAPPVQNQDKHHVLYKDGTWLEYDRKEHKLHGVIKGEVDLEIEQDATLLVKGDADLEVEGATNVLSHGEATVESKTKLNLKAPSVHIYADQYLLASYGGSGSAGIIEADLRQRGDYYQEGDFEQVGNQQQTGDRQQTGDETVAGTVTAELLDGPLGPMAMPPSPEGEV